MNITYTSKATKAESRTLGFVCFNEIYTYMTVLTPQDEFDFSVSYNIENDKFCVLADSQLTSI